MVDKTGKPVSQRQLRVGEMVRQSLGMIFARNEAKVPNLETNTITVTEVKMSQDLKIAKHMCYLWEEKTLRQLLKN